MPFLEDLQTPTTHFIEAAKAANAPFVLNMSAAGANPEAPLQDSGLPHAIIRHTFFQESIVNFHGHTIRHEQAFYGAVPTGATAYLSAHDIASAAAEILSTPEPHKGKTYELAGPEALTEHAVAKIVGEVLGRDIAYKAISSEAMSQAMRSNGLPDWMTDPECIKEAGYTATTDGHLSELIKRAPRSMRRTIEAHRDALS